MSFWRHREPEFDHDKFNEFLDGLILGKMEGIVADLTKLQTDVDALGVLVNAAIDKIETQATKIGEQATRITELEAQIAANPGADPQGPVDALDAKVLASSTALTTATG